jgi:hypothetical protein
VTLSLYDLLAELDDLDAGERAERLGWPDDDDDVTGTSRLVSLNPALAERRVRARDQLRAALLAPRPRRLLDVACSRQHRAAEVWATVAGPVYVARIRDQRADYNARHEVRSMEHELIVYVDELSTPTSWLEHPARVPAWCRCQVVHELDPAAAVAAAAGPRRRVLVGTLR